MNRLERLVAIGILVVGAMAFVGYALGSSSVPSESEVTRERDQARAAAEQAAAEQAFEESRKRGYQRGLVKGRKLAESSGAAAGTDQPCPQGQTLQEGQGCISAPSQDGTAPDGTDAGCPSGQVPLAAGGCGPPAPPEQDGQ